MAASTTPALAKFSRNLAICPRVTKASGQNSAGVALQPSVMPVLSSHPIEFCESICVWNIRKAGDGAMSNGRESEKTDKQQYE